jgi:hypothetical protein
MLLGRGGSGPRMRGEDLISGAERLLENSSLGEGGGEGVEDSTIRRVRLCVGEAPSQEEHGVDGRGRMCSGG